MFMGLPVDIQSRVGTVIRDRDLMPLTVVDLCRRREVVIVRAGQARPKTDVAVVGHDGEVIATGERGALVSRHHRPAGAASS